MTETLHVLTPVSRPELLPQVEASLFTALERAPLLELDWHVLRDPRREHVGGWGLRNRMLDEIADGPGWVWPLDDDTEAHPDVLARLCELTGPSTDLFLFAQTRPGGWEPGCADPDRLAEGGAVPDGGCAFDIGQAIFRRRLVGDYRFDETLRGADALFWTDVLARAPRSRVAWTPEVLAFYNSLRPT